MGSYSFVKGTMPWKNLDSEATKLSKKRIDAAYYQRTKEKNNPKRAQWKREFLEWALSLKESPCQDCGLTFHPVCMDWDHRDPSTKLGNVATIARQCNRQKLLEEIAKCDLVCANCHRLRTFLASSNG